MSRVSNGGQCERGLDMGMRAGGVDSSWAAIVRRVNIFNMFAVLIFLASLLAAIPSAKAAAQFSYDLSGRLIQAVAPSGAAVQYQYDAAGNLLGIAQVASGTLTIAGFSPAGGAPGSTVTISGSGFDATASRNTVTIGGVAASVTSSSANQMTVTVPPAAVSGPIVVTNALGSATSATNFLVGSPLSGGAPAVNLTFSASQAGVLTFAGSAGDGWTLAVNDLSTGASGAAVTATVAQPGGAVLASCSSASASLICTLPVLPATGTYMVTISIASGSGSGAVQLVADQQGGLLSPNVATTVSSNAAQVATGYTFAANAGESDLMLSFAGNTMAGSTSANVYNPDGTTLTSTTLSASSGATQLNLSNLAGGLYRVRIISSGTGAGSIQMTLLKATSGTTLTVGGALAAVNLVAGQNGQYTFDGTQGQYIGIGVTNLATVPAGKSISFTVTNPDGTQVSNFSMSSDGGSPIAPLPMTGMFTLTVDPGTSAAAFNLRLTSDTTGTLQLNATPVTWSRSTAGQYATYSFAATAGQSYTVQATASTFGGSTYVYVYRPDGSTWTSGAAGSPTPIVLSNAPTTGTYEVRVVPSGTDTGRVAIGLGQATSGALSLNAAPVSANVALGGSAMFSFSGKANQLLGLALTNLSTVPAGNSVSVTLADSSGATVGTCTVGMSAYSRFNATGCALPSLPADDSYSLTIAPASGGAVAFDVQLVSDQTGTLATNGVPTTFASGTVAQNAAYTFSATAGQSYQLSLTADSFLGSTYAYVYKPDGAMWMSTAASQGSTAQLNLPAAPVSGTYLVRIEPTAWEAATDSVSVALTLSGTTTVGNGASGTLTAGAAPSQLNIAASQPVSYTFNGTAGQNLGLGLTNFSTTPSGHSVTVTVADSSGTSIASFNSAVSTGYALPPLPATDVYTVTVDPGTSAANLNLQLLSDQTAALPINGAPATFTSTTVGQYATYNFVGTAGESVAVQVSGDQIPGYTGIVVYAPDGKQWASTRSGSNGTKFNLPSLPVAGTYAVRVVPTGAYTGTVMVGVTQTAAASLPVGVAAQPISLAAGQNGVYSFSSTQGQNLGFGLTNLSTSPSNRTLTVTIANSNGTVLASYSPWCSTAYALPTLPMTDTYTVTVDPGTAAATFNLQLLADQTATLALNGVPTTFTSNAAGQYATYSFAGVAGQSNAVIVTGNSFSGSTYVYVYKPDGTLWTSTSTSGSTQFNLPALPVAGAYSLRVEPQGTATGSLTLGMTQSAAGGVLNASGGALGANLAAGQKATYTFSGTQGQNAGLGLTGLATTPSGKSVTVTIADSDGTQVGSFTASASTGYAVPTLPITDTYTVTIDPGMAAAQFGVQFLVDNTAALVANAAPTAFASNAVGQYATYSFAGTAGQSDALVVSANALTGGATIYVYTPDGAQWDAASVSKGSSTQINLPVMPVSGAYIARIVPSGAATGSLDIALTQTSAGAILNAVSPATSVSLIAGQNASYTFSGTQGQNFGLGVTGLSTTPTGRGVHMTVTDSSGTVIASTTLSAFTNYVLPTLPATDTYTVMFDPDTATATFNLQLVADQTGTLPFDGGTITFSSSVVGQNATYSVAGTAGLNSVLALSADTFAGLTWVYVYLPDGTFWTSTYVGAGGSTHFTVPTMPTSGAYTFRVEPSGATTGSLSMSLSQNGSTPINGNSAGTLTAGAAPVAVNIAAGQTINYSFSGTKGQWLGLGLTNQATTPSGQTVSVKVIDSGGTQIASFSHTSSTGYALPALPLTDTYTVSINAGSAAASFNLQLLADQTGTLAQNGSPAVFTSNTIGQYATFSFAGTAGQAEALALTADSFPLFTSAHVYAPDGSLWTSNYIGTGGSQINLPILPATGTYLVRILPPDAATGSLSIGLRQTATSALTAGGAPLGVSLLAGQNAAYSFSGVQGQRLGLGLTGLSTTPSNGKVTVTILNPSGTQLTSFYTSSATNTPIPALRATGTYVVTVDPGTAAATFNLQLTNDQTGTLTVNGAPTVFTCSAVGQNASYSFAGVAGENYALVLNAAGFDNYTNVYVYSPDGAQWAQTSVYPSSSGTQFNMPRLPTTGTYIVRIEPPSTSTGSITIGVTQASATTATNAGTLTAGGGPVAVNVAADQAVSYTFSGTEGQMLGLGVSSLATTPAGQNVAATITASNGSVIGNFSAVGNTGYALPALPSTDTYAVVVNPGANAASLNLQLNGDAAGTLTPNGAPVVYASSTVGQSATYSFAGVAGQANAVLTLSADTYPGATTVFVFNPDGTQLASASMASGGTQQVPLPALAQTGNYSVRVVPSVWGGSVQMALTWN